MLTLGVEQEVFLIDENDSIIQDRNHPLLASLRDNRLLGFTELQPEFFLGQFELRTDNKPSVVSELIEELRVKHKELFAICEAASCRPLMTGTHPGQDWPDLNYSRKGDPDFPRYRLAAKRYLINGLHVHVGIQNGDDRLYVSRVLRVFEPLFLGLCASSPIWRNENTDMASARLLNFQGLPLSRGAPWLYKWGSLELLRDLRRQGCRFSNPANDQSDTSFFWSIRPHHNGETIEVRTMDANPSILVTAGVVALIQCLIHWILNERPEPEEFFPTKLALEINPQVTQTMEERERREVLRSLCEENLWRAQRDGVKERCELINLFSPTGLDQVTTIKAKDVICHLIEFLADTARTLSCYSELRLLGRILEQPSSWERQLDCVLGNAKPNGIRKAISGEVEEFRSNLV